MNSPAAAVHDAQASASGEGKRVGVLRCLVSKCSNAVNILVNVYIHVFNENLDSKLYSKIVKDNAPASANMLLPAGEQRCFLQDNAPTQE